MPKNIIHFPNDFLDLHQRFSAQCMAIFGNLVVPQLELINQAQGPGQTVSQTATTMNNVLKWVLPYSPERLDQISEKASKEHYRNREWPCRKSVA
jgi:hypothetical protein